MQMDNGLNKAVMMNEWWVRGRMCQSLSVRLYVRIMTLGVWWMKSRLRIKRSSGQQRKSFKMTSGQINGKRKIKNRTFLRDEGGTGAGAGAVSMWLEIDKRRKTISENPKIDAFKLISTIFISLQCVCGLKTLAFSCPSFFSAHANFSQKKSFTHENHFNSEYRLWTRYLNDD